MNIYKRQSNLVKPDQLNFPILLIGCGGTGSWTGLALAKMGCKKIIVVDFDLVESHNIPSQAYSNYSVSCKKSYELVSSYMYKNTETKHASFSALDMTFEDFFIACANKSLPVVICAIDSMDERIKLWDIIKKRNDVELFLDPRIGGELLRMYAVDPLDNKAVAFYESQLYSSSKADPLPCGSRQIIYTTMFTGALIANYVKKYAKKEPIRAETIMDFSTMNLI